MDLDTIIRLTSQGLLTCLYVSLPIVLVAAGVGLLVSFVQAITSMQDSSITYGVKLVAVTITVVVLARWGGAQVENFAEAVMTAAFAR
ncbi:type III secretion system export apparatus subunit SctS [Paraburkholderia sp. CI3]|uniref:type III secretion system export apparatus subunit SctS n=1 Tax=Paraburkholderia sp. CI3 TaxID=2991060 RepID=UPI003D1BC382